MREPYKLTETDALIITDIQNDFLPNGTLPIPNSQEIIPIINGYIKRFEAAQAHIITSRDWHPPNHTSFIPQTGPWPPHCVQNTFGAKFSPNLKLPPNTLINSKATKPDHEVYSAFEDTNLSSELYKRGVKRIFILGLATDYCVLDTTLDACELGFETIVLIDAIRGINAEPGDVEHAMTTMHNSGADLATETDFSDEEDTLPVEQSTPDALAAKPSMLIDAKKKARMRPKGANKRLKTEK
ncbi:MAG: isochorismatase family protein [Nitrososphaerota archaeon]|nr:isochorismatase family protein [Nitrososphaerota archaeon]